MDIPQASGWAHITISKLACEVCFEKQIEIKMTDSVFDKQDLQSKVVISSLDRILLRIF